MHSSRGGAKQQWAAEFKVAMLSPNVDVQIQGWVRFTNANGFVGITKDRLLELIGMPANGTVSVTDDYIQTRLEETVWHTGREDKRGTWFTSNIVTILSKQKTAVITVILDGSPPPNLEAVVRTFRGESVLRSRVRQSGVAHRGISCSTRKSIAKWQVRCGET